MSPPEQLGKYTLLERIGVGGMAEVWLARASGPGGFSKGCVVKMVRPGVDQERFSRMFMDEARLSSLLNHPNIVQVFDFGEEAGRLYIGMEFIQGRTLRALLKKLDQRNIRLPLDHGVKILGGVLQGLEYAHNVRDNNGEPLRVIHRDVSPENVMVGYSGMPKLVDFGIAKATMSTDRTRDGRAKGKLTYMAPEQLLGAPLDNRVDIHACGVMLYELCTGRHPFPISQPEALARAIVDDVPPHPQRLDPGLPDDVCDIIMCALEKDPAKRFAHARDMLGAMDTFGQTLTVSTTSQRVESFIQFIFAEEMEQDAERARRASGPVTSMPPREPAVTALPPAAPPPSADLMLSDERDTVKEDPRAPQRPAGSPVESVRPRGQVVVPVPDRMRSQAAPDAPTALRTVPTESPGDLPVLPAPPLPTGENLLDTRERAALDNVFAGKPARQPRMETEPTAGRAPARQDRAEPSLGPAAGAALGAERAREWDNTSGTGLTGPVLKGRLWYVPRRVALTALGVTALASGAVTGSMFYIGGVQAGRSAILSRSGTLAVVADESCALQLDGSPRGNAPLARTELPAGTHEVVTDCAAVRTRTPVQLATGQDVVLVMPRVEKRSPPPKPARPDPAPAPAPAPGNAPAAPAAQAPPAALPAEGYVVVVARKPATLFVDGKKLGDVPDKPLALAPGNHSIRVVTQKDRKDRTLVVSVERGKTAAARFP